MSANPTSEKTAYNQLWPAYRPFLVYLRPDLKRVLLDYLTIVIAVATNAAMIWLIGAPFNLLQQGQYDAVLGALMVFGAVVVVNQLSQLAGGMLTNTIGFRVIGRLRNRILEQALYLSFPVLNRMERGDLLARLSNDVDRVKNTIVDALILIVSHVLTFGTYVFMLFWIDVQLALWALAISPLFVVHQKLFAPAKHRAAEQFYHHNGRLLGFEEQALANSRGISNYTAEGFVRRWHQKVFERARYWATRDRNIDVAYGTTFAFLIYLTGLIIVLLGVDGIREQRFGIGHLVSFMLYLGYLTVPTRGLADILFQAFGGLGAVARIQALFQCRPLTQAAAGAPALDLTAGRIELTGLQFGYPGKTSLYHGLDLQIDGGTTVAIVGPSGAGKSTLAYLLDYYYPLSGGSITIDGQDVAQVATDSLRRAITIVSQEPFLLNDSVRANLLMVRPDASDEQIQTACRDSFALEFVEKLPQGLDTEIGSGGVDLSAGQQQRLSLAQAFLRDTPILVMDEATSALDSHSEQQVIQAMQRLRRGRTTLLIAHRYSSIQTADQVIYLNGDGTAAQGSHEALMIEHTGYREAVQWQTQKRDQ